jgi:hypothetical protein
MADASVGFLPLVNGIVHGDVLKKPPTVRNADQLSDRVLGNRSHPMHRDMVEIFLETLIWPYRETDKDIRISDNPHQPPVFRDQIVADFLRNAVCGCDRLRFAGDYR